MSHKSLLTGFSGLAVQSIVSLKVHLYAIL